MECLSSSNRRFGMKLTALLLMVVFGCSKDSGFEVKTDPTSRTVLYYLAAENDLHVEADEKVEALRLGFPRDSHNQLVIYKDIPGDVPRLLEVYADASGENRIRTVKTYPEQNSAAAETIQMVLVDLETFFPADSYGFILFSHATGWLPEGTPIRPEVSSLRMGLPAVRTYTIAMDENNELGLKEFALAIPDHFFEFMVFEACFMAGVEVLYELKDKTGYIISSSAEMLAPGFTPIYPKSLPLLLKPKADLIGFAKAFFDFWDSQHGDYRSATISVVDTDGLAPLAAWVRENAIVGWSAENLNTIQHFDRYRGYRLFFDFEDYYRHMMGRDNIHTLASLLEKTVLYKAATATFIPSQLGFTIKNHSGITMYIPQARFQPLNAKYAALNWFDMTGNQ